MEDIYEPDMEECEHCEVTYSEYDTGYKEFGCSFVTGNAKDCECLGGRLDFYCPLAFRYSIER